MKTLQSILTIAMTILISINGFANNFGIHEENYIDDIPFDTKAIFDSIQNNPDQDVCVSMMDETYINDIPFDTEKIAATYRSDSAMSIRFELPEEETIDDIPFNTLYIASNLLYREYDRMPIIFLSVRK